MDKGWTPGSGRLGKSEDIPDVNNEFHILFSILCYYC
jgi:hypothetical protein